MTKLHLYEGIDNVPEIDDTVAVVEVTMAQAKEDSDEQERENKDLLDNTMNGKFIAHKKPFTSADNQPQPKVVELPFLDLDESLFEEAEEKDFFNKGGSLKEFYEPQTYTFITLPMFDRAAKNLGLNDSDISTIKSEILKRKDTLPPIKKLKGTKKIRVALPDNNKGKSGGARVLFLEISLDDNEIYLIYVFSKKDEDNLSSQEEKIIKKIVTALKGR